MELRFNFGLLPALILLVGLGLMLVTNLSPRDISMGEGDMYEMVVVNSFIDNLSRVLTAIILALCGFKILSVIKEKKVPSGGSGILFPYLMFFLCTTLTTALLGKNGDLKIQMFYVPFVLIAVYLTRPIPTIHILSLSKFILLIYIYGSLLAAVFVPSRALLGTYESLLPGVDTRLFGISGHANQLGAFAAVYLAMEFLKPARTKFHIIHLATALFVLIWAQSKTAWGFVLLAILYFLFAKVERALFSKINMKLNFGKFLLYALGVVTGLGLFVMVTGLINIAPSSSGIDEETWTGRGIIWKITLDAWATNPIFGYGLSLWDKDFRDQYGMFYVGHSHNQFIDTLGSAGMIGLLGLLIYLLALFKRAIKIVKENPVALALLAFILIDSATETPLRNSGVLTGYFFLHLLLFAQLRTVR